MLGIDVGILDCGEALLELIVVGRPKEREWGDQRSSTDTGDNVELGPGPGFGPAGENSGSEGATAATAGKRQRIELSQFDGWVGLSRFYALVAKQDEVISRETCIGIAPDAHVAGVATHFGCGHVFLRHAIA